MYGLFISSCAAAPSPTDCRFPLARIPAEPPLPAGMKVKASQVDLFPGMLPCRVYTLNPPVLELDFRLAPARRWIREASVTLAAVAGALLIRAIVQPWLGPAYPFVTLLPAITAISLWRGYRMALAAIILGWVGAELLFVEPLGYPLPVRREDWVGAALYFVAALLFVAIGEQRLRALRRETERRRDGPLLAAIVQSSYDAIISKDLNGTITSWNSAAERLYGYTAQEVIGKHISLIVPEDRRPELDQIMASIRRGELVDHFDTVRVAKDGRRVPVSLRISPVRDPDGRIVGASKTAHDIGPELAAEEAIRASEARFRVMADSAPVLIWISGTDKLCTWFNRPWLEFRGRTLEQELGNGRSEGVHPDDLDRCLETYNRAFEARRRFTMEYQLRRHDGQYRWVLDTGVPLVVDGGQFRGYVGSCIDITERKEAETERERLLASERVARSEAERLSRVKDDFVATLSHELRTPLNAILGWSQLVRRPDVDPADLAEGLTVIERNARTQSQMIEDLLDVSRITAGKLRLHIERVDVAKVVEQALASAKPAAEAKRIRLQPVLDPRTNLVNGDPTRLQQIVWNLLSNAIKFTPKGGKVQVILRRVNSSVQITVVDTGKGISPEFLQQIFDRFRQEDSSTTRRFSGLGLGLAIVKHLTELHGGTVRAASEGEGLGAAFTVELPLAILHPPPTQPAASEVQPVQAKAVPYGETTADLSGVRVLVVDDEPDSRDLISRVLRERRARVWSAESAAEGLRLFHEHRPGVILSDIGMPVQDGYDFMKTIRLLGPEQGGRTPAAALTALARSEDRTKALMAGFQLHVSKPIEPSELVAVVVSLAKLSDRG